MRSSKSKTKTNINKEKQSLKQIKIKEKTIHFNSLTLKQKIAQMIIIRGKYKENIHSLNLNIGGIFLDNQKSKKNYKNITKKYQNKSKIKLLIATDMEGDTPWHSWHPFHKFKKFPKFSKIKTPKQAYNIGLEQGKLMKQLGFNLNFSPVSEFTDKVYKGRAFLGTKTEIKKKLEMYITGLQKNVFGTCKHYPGKSMIKNLHFKSHNQKVSKENLELFNTCFKKNISSVMISHTIVSGIVSSNNKPSTVSKELIDNLKNFKGLIISDEINMLGLKKFYFSNKIKLYTDLINAGENLILDFKLKPSTLYKIISKVEDLVLQKKINKQNINNSVKKILKLKGYKIV